MRPRRTGVLVAAILAANLFGMRPAVAEVVYWVPAADGSWAEASNWSNGKLPAVNDDVRTNPQSLPPRTITVDSVHPAVKSFNANDNLVIRSRQFTVGAGGGEVTGSLVLENPTTTAWSYFKVDAGDFTARGETTLEGWVSLYASNGGKFALPGLATVVPGGSSRTVEFGATGAGSVLDLSGLATIQDPGNWWNLRTYARSGGKTVVGNVSVGNPASGGRLYFEATGVGSTLDMSALSAIPYNTSAGRVWIDVGYGANVIVAPTLTELPNGHLYVGAGGSFRDSNENDAFPNLTTVTNGYIDVNGASPNLPGVTTVHGSELYASYGGTLALPSVSTYKLGGEYTSVTRWEATGEGALLDLSSLRTIEATPGWEINLESSDGGRMILDGLDAIPAGGRFRATTFDAGSVIDLSSLSSIQADAQLNAWYGAEIRFNPNGVANFEGVSLDVDGASVTGGTFVLGAGSEIWGEGMIDANVVNASGTVAPSWGPLTITGDYTQQSRGTLGIELTSAVPGYYDELEVEGGVLLDGLLDLIVTEDAEFELESGMEFWILRAGSLAGTFSQLPQGALAWSESGGDGDQLFIDYRPNGVLLLTSVPEPATCALLVSGAVLVGLVSLVRRRQASSGCFERQ